jgi:hypothetical protein
MNYFFVRVGILGEVTIGASQQRFEHGNHVVLRSIRGVELGRVLAPYRGKVDHGRAVIQILRNATSEDELLARRLERHKRRALKDCRQELRRLESSATLLDVDHLLDGQRVVFHFLGPVDPEVESQLQALVSTYESVVQTAAFARRLEQGCGEGCGASDHECAGTKCGSTDQGCSTCAVASAKKQLSS